MCQGVQKVVLNALFKLLPNLPLQIEIPKVKSVLQNINHVKQKCKMIQTRLVRKISYIIFLIRKKKIEESHFDGKNLEIFHICLLNHIVKCVAKGLGERVT